MPESKSVVVTGAAGNLGSALCGLLAERGWRVIAVDRDAEMLRKRLSEVGVTAQQSLAISNLAEAAQAKSLVAQCAGTINAVAHTVGGFAWANFPDSGADLFDRMYQMNLLTTVNLFHAVWPKLQAAGGGSLVAIGAGAALKSPAGMSAYGASKAGVLRLIESLADEGKGHGIRANAVMPSIIDTPQNRAAMPDADTSKWVTPQQVSEVIAFLISDASEAVTGAAIPITGRG